LRLLTEQLSRQPGSRECCADLLAEIANGSAIQVLGEHVENSLTSVSCFVVGYPKICEVWDARF
jgi:hypothetical protein